MRYVPIYFHITWFKSAGTRRHLAQQQHGGPEIRLILADAGELNQKRFSRRFWSASRERQKSLNRNEHFRFAWSEARQITSIGG